MPATYKTLGRRIARQLTDQPTARRTLRALSQRGLLPPSMWMRLPVEGEFTVTLPGGELFQYASVADDGIGRALYWQGTGAWEVETIDIYYRLAKKSKVIVDIGANTGVYTLIACAANEQAQVYAFEPVPQVYERLSANVHLNQWQGRCTLQKIAISSSDGIVQFHIPHGAVPKSASLKIDGFRGVDGFVADVPAATLDSICGDEQIDLVKIDVEGFEDQVLMGMRGILQRSAPAIIVECNFDGPFRQVEAILVEYNYSFFHLKLSGPQQVVHIQPDAEGHYRNYLCLPAQRMEAIR